jgi:Skp family chaperone for outer membrane proteins
MSELVGLSQKDIASVLENFFNTLNNAQSNIAYHKSKNQAMQYINLLDKYSSRIDMDLNNSVLNLKMIINRDYNNIENLDNDAISRISSHYRNLMIRMHNCISYLSKNSYAEYSQIIQSIEKSVNNINENMDSHFSTLNKRIDTLEKMLDPKEIQRQKEAEERKNIELKKQKEREEQEERKTQKISRLKSSINSVEFENLIKITQKININLEDIFIYNENNVAIMLANFREKEQMFNIDYRPKEFIGIEISNNSITRLDINNYSLNSIPNINNLKNLNYLDLDDNKIENIKGLEYLKKLSELHLRSNKVYFDIEGLNNLESVQNLNLKKIHLNTNYLIKGKNFNFFLKKMEEKGYKYDEGYEIHGFILR